MQPEKCYRDCGMFGGNVALVHCQRAQIARLTAQLKASEEQYDALDGEHEALKEAIRESLPEYLDDHGDREDEKGRIEGAARQIDRLTAQLAAATARAGEAEMRLGMASHFNTPEGDRIGAIVDRETARPSGGWVVIPAGKDVIKGADGKVTAFPTADAAFAALRAGGGR